MAAQDIVQDILVSQQYISNYLQESGYKKMSMFS